MTPLVLTDEELLHLDGRCSEKVQAAVDAAKARVQARRELPDLTPTEAGFVADVVSEAAKNGLLLWQFRRIRRCGICGESKGYHRFKSGPRKGAEDYKRPLTLQGIELADRSVTFEGSVTLGGCQECVVKLAPVLAEALRDVNAELPVRLRAPAAPRRVRWQNRRCTQCDWHGHEGEMTRRPTVLGDGTYPAGCPQCGAENVFFGRRLVEIAYGFTVVAGEDHNQ